MALFETVVILVTLVLLPLLPAWLLFRYLPSGADTTGTLAGLKVKLGGAFGGYVALTVFLAWFFSHSLRGPMYHDWHVSGALQFEGSDQPRVADISCILKPPMLDLDQGNGFEFDVSLPDAMKQPPRLFFQVPGYESRTVFLLEDPPYGVQKLDRKVDKLRGKVEFTTPIVLKKVTAPYQPAAAAQEIPAPGGSS
jgi:hypothetical protein